MDIPYPPFSSFSSSPPSPFINNSEPQQSFYTSQTVCPECNNSLPLIQIDGWCKDCEKFNFQKTFSKWTSGNESIDNFIKETQLKSTRPIDYLEWIPYERFKDIKLIDKSNNDINNGYGNVATAIWLDGPRWSWNEEILKWQRTGETIVALKIMEKTKNINSDYFNELKKCYNCTAFNNNIVHCYGISRDPTTKHFIMVMEYADRGSLHNYLIKNFSALTWEKRIKFLCNIASGLRNIHNSGLVHHNIHSGNILMFSDYNEYSAITDVGLCNISSLPSPIPKSPSPSNYVYGVLPYLAPEVLKGRKPTKASDMFSIGIIMCELTTGKRPHQDRAHDSQLINEICDGLRPEITEDTPSFYKQLMQKCWDPDPAKRPTAEILYDLLTFKSEKVIKQIRKAEKRRMIMLRQREQALISKMNAKYAKLELHSGNVNVNGGGGNGYNNHNNKGNSLISKESKMALLQLSELQKVHQQAYYSSRPIPIVITSPRVSLEHYGNKNNNLLFNLFNF